MLEKQEVVQELFSQMDQHATSDLYQRAVNDVIQYLAEQFRSPVMYQVENNGKSVFKSAGGNEDD